MFRNLTDRIATRLVAHARDYPRLFPVAMRLRHRRRREKVVTPQTQICIEGFPRSGNTFATVAFRQAQPGPVRIAHHCHHEAQIRLAVRWGLPAVLLVRNPVDACVSLAIWRGGASVEKEIDRWITFHENLSECLNRVVIGEFHEVVDDFAVVIDRVNKKFEKSFSPFFPSAVNLQKIESVIREASVGHRKDEKERQRKIGWPSSDRATKAAELKQRVQKDEVLAQKINYARELYMKIVSCKGPL